MSVRPRSRATESSPALPAVTSNGYSLFATAACNETGQMEILIILLTVLDNNEAVAALECWPRSGKQCENAKKESLTHLNIMLN